MNGATPAAGGLIEAVADLIADHPMWIGDDGQPLDYLPEREARIADFVREVTEAADREVARVTAAVDEYLPHEWSEDASLADMWSRIAALRAALSSADTTVPCNCGWGGVHDPDNPRCQKNRAAAVSPEGGDA